MLCFNCGAPMDTHRENYRYTASGLPHVTLHQVEVSRCSACGETEVAIPHIEDLHRTIATMLVRKPTRLAPEEIRYLRKYLGWSGANFAKYMGVAPETTSRWENNRERMGKGADRLLRLLVVREVPVQDYSNDLLKEITEEPPKQSMHVEIGLSADDEDWHPTALAIA